jgi:cytoskeletal protein CcmA (bactofilin family)
VALFKNTWKKNIPAKRTVKPQSPSVQAVPLPSDSGGGVALRQTTVGHLEISNYLDRGCALSGKIHFEGPAQIEGNIDGEIDAKESLIIGKNAVVAAPVKAKAVIVAGEVAGHINAGERIELEASAKVSSNLTASVLVVHEGAILDGYSLIQPVGTARFGQVFDTKTGRLVQVAEGRDVENGVKPFLSRSLPSESK